MVGMASIDHLKELILQQNNDTTEATNNNNNEYRQDLWDEAANNFIIRQDVIMKYGTAVGNLTVGHDFAAHNHFGPELGFGWILGDTALLAQKKEKKKEKQLRSSSNKKGDKGPILIIKSAYGGRNLAIDFRPPASGEGNFSGVKPVHYGWEYRQMITDFVDALDSLADYVPSYNENDGYELAGLVWFQGWNDMLDWRFVSEYGINLANLIRDVRRDLDAPELPVIIGELGMHGLHPTGKGSDRVMQMRAMERGVTLLNEFCNNSLFVRTAPYVIQNGTTYGGGYHYYGRADTYFHIGKAFGRGMLKFWDPK